MKRPHYHSMGGGSTGDDESWQPVEERKKLRAGSVLRAAMQKCGIYGIEGAAGKVAERITSSKSDPLISFSSESSNGGDMWRSGPQDDLIEDEAFEDSGLESARKRGLGSDDDDEHSNTLGEHSKVWVQYCKFGL